MALPKAGEGHDHHRNVPPSSFALWASLPGVRPDLTKQPVCGPESSQVACTALMTSRLEAAFRWAAECHEGQTRKGSRTPYVEHVAAVALVVDRAGFDEDVVIAGLLHDVVEDTGAPWKT